ncbi:hypothetical protein ACXIUT_25040 [Achromobacter denitrificans]|jgi:hypothetical protein|uniref:hypothetical protein n=1 Tax=Achromobacter sp. 2789STDY5608633 TaxID=1806501 RepID=UPI0006C8B392|nr:hypothetical protein [Achromobacter sp. 2789STDY5608633]
MPRKVEPFSPNVLPHYDGQYRIFDKVGDVSITRLVKYATYSQEAGWAPAAPKLGWIGMSHRLGQSEVDRLRTEILYWAPVAANTVDVARKAVKLFRNAAQARANRGSLRMAQLASFYFQIAKSLVAVVQERGEWGDDFPSSIDIQAQREGADNLDMGSSTAVREAVEKFMAGNGRDLPPDFFRTIAED